MAIKPPFNMILFQHLTFFSRVFDEVLNVKILTLSAQRLNNIENYIFRP